MASASARPSPQRRSRERFRSANTYRFRGFNERINSIHLTTHHHTALLPSSSSSSSPSSSSLDPSSSDSHFLTQLVRQADLDHSTAFKGVARQLRPLTRSFPLVVHHKHAIVRILLHALTLPESISPAPFLSLLTTLARDLRSEFLPLFPLVMTTLLSMLDPSQPEQLQQLFSALLFLFKFLQRQLVEQVPALHRRYFARLLRHPRWWIRRFAGESLAYLLRKVRAERREEVYRVVMGWPQEEERMEEGMEDADGSGGEAAEVRRLLKVKAMGMSEYRDGIATLLFHTHRSVQYAFHSLTPASLPVLLGLLRCSPASPALSHHHFLILSAFFRRLANYTRRDQSSLCGPPSTAISRKRSVSGCR